MNNRFELTDDGLYAIIYLRHDGGERATLIDAGDLPRVSALNGRWYAQRRNWTFYAAITIGSGKSKQTIRMHRYIMDAPADMEVDHANHDGLDNRRSINLALVPPDKNKQNCRATGTGRDIGRRWYESKCVVAELPF